MSDIVSRPYRPGDQVTIQAGVRGANKKIEGTWVVGDVTTDSFTIRNPTRWERIRFWAERWWGKVRRWML